MPRTINPIRKAKLKQGILKGKSYRQALEDAGYSKITAHNSGNTKAVKVCKKEIAEEFRLSKITPEYVLSRLDNIANTARNASDKNRSLELLGRYLALFKDSQINFNTIPDEEKKLLDEYIRINKQKSINEKIDEKTIIEDISPCLIAENDKLQSSGE